MPKIKHIMKYFQLLICIFVLGNPLVCNCKIMWLKSWLSESSSIGPKCADGTYVKGMPFSRNDCPNLDRLINAEEESKYCITHENQALLPNLATAQVFSTLDKVKDYTAQIKNAYQNNKISARPSPEESEYFYDEYVDYPYNDTLIDGLNNDVSNNGTKSQYTVSEAPTLPTLTKNVTQNSNKMSNKPSATSNAPSSGFTFFGMPLPTLNVGKLWNTGRKIDYSDGKMQQQSGNSFTQVPPKFETGGFSPVLPTTAGGFMPIPNPTKANVTVKTIPRQGLRNQSQPIMLQNLGTVEETTPSMKVQATSSSTHKKVKTEIHELQAYLDDDNSTHVAYNRTKNIEEQKGDQGKLSKYNLMESNVTITQVTEKEGLLITTDTTNDMSLHGWLETSTMSYSSSPVTSKPPIKKHVENQPTALSAILIPDDIARRNQSTRPATITKVNLPHVEQFDPRRNYAPVINREGKTRFPESTGNTKTRNADGKEWYYRNYNNSNLEPYIAPEVHLSNSNTNRFKSLFVLFTLLVRFLN